MTSRQHFTSAESLVAHAIQHSADVKELLAILTHNLQDCPKGVKNRMSLNHFPDYQSTEYRRDYIDAKKPTSIISPFILLAKNKNLSDKDIITMVEFFLANRVKINSPTMIHDLFYGPHRLKVPLLAKIVNLFVHDGIDLKMMIKSPPGFGMPNLPFFIHVTFLLYGPRDYLIADSAVTIRFMWTSPRVDELYRDFNAQMVQYARQRMESHHHGGPPFSDTVTKVRKLVAGDPQIDEEVERVRPAIIRKQKNHMSTKLQGYDLMVQRNHRKYYADTTNSIHQLRASTLAALGTLPLIEELLHRSASDRGNIKKIFESGLESLQPTRRPLVALEDKTTFIRILLVNPSIEMNASEEAWPDDEENPYTVERGWRKTLIQVGGIIGELEARKLCRYDFTPDGGDFAYSPLYYFTVLHLKVIPDIRSMVAFYAIHLKKDKWLGRIASGLSYEIENVVYDKVTFAAFLMGEVFENDARISRVVVNQLLPDLELVHSVLEDTLRFMAIEEEEEEEEEEEQEVDLQQPAAPDTDFDAVD